MEKEGLPPYTAVARPRRPWLFTGAGYRLRQWRKLQVFGVWCIAFIAVCQLWQSPWFETQYLSVDRLYDDLEACKKFKHKPEDPIGIGREKNARWLGGKATLIKNATVWVGEPKLGTPAEEAHFGKGYEWINNTNVVLMNGLIANVGKVVPLPDEYDTYDAKGRPLTAGIIDMHSHSGVDPLPELGQTDDTNEASSDTTPYVRSIDGIDPLDPQLKVIKSGGVTTSLILPGSANNIGGEAYVVKHAVGPESGRKEISANDMLADPEKNWRYMKMACGENAKRVYGKIGRGPTSRLGESWFFRHAFEKAAALVREQDDWCSEAEAVGIESMKGYLPMDLEWESLTAVLRGQVHVNTHCYTVRDLEAYVDHTNEFKFAVRAFHHAHETFIVPEILKRTYGGIPPASALFADNMFYKSESYRGSEYAGKYLWENNLTAVYVSDNPVLNAQHVLLEAAKAYRYGLPYHAALAGVTSAPAHLLGLGKRMGKLVPGYDADVVVWDSDPLELGAAPVQVWIDGVAQFEDPVELDKPYSGPIVQDESLREEKGAGTDEDVVYFTGVSAVLLGREVVSDGKSLEVAVRNGKIVCVEQECAKQESATGEHARVVDLKNGYITPPFTAFGSYLGLNAIDAEKETDNGGSDGKFSRAVDGLALDTKKLHVAHEYGVTKAISAPKLSGGMTHYGTSAGFHTGARSLLDDGAVWADDVAVHCTLTTAAKRGDTPSTALAIGKLREKLLKAVKTNDTDKYSEEAYLEKVVKGEMPIVLTVHSADTIAAALKLKTEIESSISETRTSTTTKLRMVILGGAESHLVASALAKAAVGVILAPFQSYAKNWDQRRALTGAPLTNGTTIDVLLDAGVKVGIGMEEDWILRDLGVLAGIAYRNGGGKVSEREAIGLAGSNIEEMLGVGKKTRNGGEEVGEFVVWAGSPLGIGGRVRAVGGGLGKVTIY